MAKKYIDAEKLKVLLSELKEEHKQHRGDFHEGVVFAVNEIVDDIEESITSLQQEQPELDFEIGKYMTTNLLKKRNHSTGIFHLTQKDYATIAHHFYELGKNSK